MAVFDTEAQVQSLRPDFEKIRLLGVFAIIATAPGSDVDFVSRFFAPAVGVPEDPVTGSAHCTLTPYWAKRLGKTQLRARQISSRGGELICEEAGERVLISGSAVDYLSGVICI
jgi:predicted PhzF superfamily epimerase YddE/YHI9